VEPQVAGVEEVKAADGMDRRDLLKSGVAVGCGAVLMTAGVAGGETAAAAPGAGPGADYNWEEHRYAFLVDISKCIGCGSCVRACSAENNVPTRNFRTWVERYLISHDHGSYIDSPNGGMDGFGPVETSVKPTKAYFVPKLCNHCTETPCIQVCPVGASYRTKDGLILVDHERCIGCGYCVQACPYGSRYINEETGCADKCTWCYHRITKGLKPACVEVCPTGTRQFGDMKKDDDPVRQQLETQPVTVLQPNLLTEPNTFYLHVDKEVR